MSNRVSITRRHAAAAAVACLHLAIVCVAAVRGLPRRDVSPAAALLETYGAYSGANNGYGFFAPGVASEWRASFRICEDEQHCVDVAEPQPNQETELLLVTIDGLFAIDEMRELVAASWAAAQFARFPHAKLVIVKAEAYIIPPMAQMRAGRKPFWRTIDAFAFTRAGADRRQRNRALHR